MSSSGNSTVIHSKNVTMNQQAFDVICRIEKHASKDRLLQLFARKTKWEAINKEKVWIDYAKFITLKILSGDFELCHLSPSPMIDRMWHLHILDTKCYEDFCKSIFPPIGPLIHHDPLGEYSPQDEKNERIANTKSAYKNVYKDECNFFDGVSQYFTANSGDCDDIMSIENRKQNEHPNHSNSLNQGNVAY